MNTKRQEGLLTDRTLIVVAIIGIIAAIAIPNLLASRRALPRRLSSVFDSHHAQLRSSLQINHRQW